MSVNKESLPFDGHTSLPFLNKIPGACDLCAPGISAVLLPGLPLLEASQSAHLAPFSIRWFLKCSVSIEPVVDIDPARDKECHNEKKHDDRHFHKKTSVIC